MNADTDLTLFWLAWQKTCSIRLCCAGFEREYQEKCATDPELLENMQCIQELAAGVIGSMNCKGISLMKKNGSGTRLSSFSAEVENWKSGVGSAFELLESHLYGKKFLKGRPFKSYLFEEIAERPGEMNRNLFGYLQRVLKTIIDESYGENVYCPKTDEDGQDVEPLQISLDGQMPLRPGYSPAEWAEVRDLEVAFREYLDDHNQGWDSDRWLIIYCVLNLLHVGSSEIQKLFSKGHQTINKWTLQQKAELLKWLRGGFSDKAIGISLNGCLQSILDEKVQKMTWYSSITTILEKKRKSTGK